MSLFAELVSDNPMLVEIARFRRKMLAGRDGGANRAALILLGVFYALIVATVLRFAADVDPVWIILFKTIFFVLLQPVLAAGAISGERERRTWEILLTTPVSKAQIVAGKFLGVAAGLGIYLLAWAVMIVGCQIANSKANIAATFDAEFLSVSLSLMLIAFSLFVSARSRTTFAAMGVCVGIVFVVYGAVPLFVAAGFQETGVQFLRKAYPFLTLQALGDREPVFMYDRAASTVPWGAAATQTIVYLVLAALFLVGANAAVRQMEEIKDLMASPKTEKGSKPSA